MACSRGRGGGASFPAGPVKVAGGIRFRITKEVEQRTVVRPDYIFIEEPKQHAGEFRLTVCGKMLQREGPGDDLAAGIGLALDLFLPGVKRTELGVELVAFLAKEFDLIGGRAAWHGRVENQGRKFIVSQAVRCRNRQLLNPVAAGTIPPFLRRAHLGITGG